MKSQQNENENDKLYLKRVLFWTFIPMLTLILLPMLINTGALGPLVIFIVYFGIIQLDKFLKTLNPPSIRVLVQSLPTGKYVLYDYYSLIRLTSKEYFTRESALEDLHNSHPNVRYETH